MKNCSNLILLVFLSLILLGCDNKDDNSQKKTDGVNKEITAEFDSDAVSIDQPIDNLADFSTNDGDKEFSPDELLIKHYQNKPFLVLDSSEILRDGASTVVVTFSVPLNPTQNFNELVSLVEETKGKVDGDWQLSKNGLELSHKYLSPNSKLRLNIDKSILAINKKPLNSSYQMNIVTRNRSPMVGFSSNGSLLPSKSMRGLPITTLNVDQIDIKFFRIKSNKLYDFIENYGSLKQLPVASSQDALSYADLVYSARFNLSPTLNVQETKIVDLSTINELKLEGVYIAILNQANQYKYSNPMTLFSVSNIGVSVHAYQNNKLSIFAHRLDDGSPLSEIKLTALCAKTNKNCDLVEVVTDKQGYAELNLNPEGQYQILTASDGQQMSFVHIAREPLDLSDFNVLGSPSYAKQLFTFTARDLYRSGDTIYLNALLRDADGQLLPNQPIKVQIINPDGQIIKDFVWKATDVNHAFYQTEFLLPANATAGKWMFKFNLGDDIYRYHYFLIEEFFAEKMAVALNSISDKAILKGQNANFSVKGWYLYGAPTSGSEVEANVAIVEERSIPELADFKIGSVTEKNLQRSVNSSEYILNHQGVADISIDKKHWSDIKSPIKLLVTTNLLDMSGRLVTRTASQSIWPANKIPAIKPLFVESRYYDWSLDQYVSVPVIELGQQAAFQIAYIDKDGKKLSSGQLSVKLVKERRDYYWTWSDNMGWQSQYDQKEFVVSEQNIKVPAGDVASVSFLPNDFGVYRLEVMDTNNVVSSVRFWNGYPWNYNTEHSGAIRPDQVKLTLDKSSYRSGDMANVYVQAPVGGAGYISLECNDGTLWVKKINVPQGGMNVEIPIKDWGRHDVYVNAMIIRPSTDSAMQTVKRAIGLLYLPINTAERQIKLTLAAPAKTHPEKTIKVKVKVDPEQVDNRQVMVLLSAVDNDVLQRTNFITPDPYSTFLGRKRYNVEQFDVYGKLIESDGSHVNMDFGGDGVVTQNQQIRHSSILAEANIVASQLTTIKLNAQGEGEIDLPIPNFNGELKLMAQAWDSNRFGYAEQLITVSAPISVKLSPPSFLAGGDKTFVTFELRNLTDLSQNITLNFSTNGLIRLLTDKISQQIKLNPQEQKIMTIPVAANLGIGEGQVIVDIQNIQLVDGQYYQYSNGWPIIVRPSYQPTSRISSTVLNGGEGWTLSSAALTDLIDNTIEAEAVFSHHLSFHITKYIKSLQISQNGNLEQIISGLYPLLIINQEQLQKLGIGGLTDAERRKSVQAGIDRIFSLQKMNGSFGLWNKESPEEYWLTVYTVDFLLRAQERDYLINQSGLDKALSRISQYLYDPSAFYNRVNYYGHDVEEYIEFSSKAYAALILANQKKITPAMRSELKRLYQQVKGNSNGVQLSPLPIMQLSIASKLTGNSRTTQDLFDIALSTSRDNQHSWLGDYGSVIRDRAQIYNLMVEYQLAEDYRAEYLLTLSSMLKNERYLSTQELSTLFLMSWQNELQQDKDKIVVLLNNKERIKATETIYRSMNYQQLTNGISVHNPHNASPLYVQFSLSGYTKKMPQATPADSILNISRQYFDIKGKSIQPNQLNVGDLIIVMLDVSAQRVINDALVIDMLPAGLVLENPNLANSSIDFQLLVEKSNLFKELSIDDIRYQEYRNDRYVAAIDIKKQIENNRYGTKLIYLTRAISAGEYVVPAPYVQSMYKPQWFAVGKTIDKMQVNDTSK